MRDCLLVMKARDIPICTAAFDSLQIHKAYFVGYTEKQLESAIQNFIAETDYENYIIASDDLVPTQKSLDIVRAQLETHEVFTGWCNMSPDNPRANIRLGPLPGRHAFFVITHGISQLQRLTNHMKNLTFPLPSQFANIDVPFRVFFMGFAFTGMRRELWLRFPFRTYSNMTNNNGNGSDYLVSDRLAKAGIPMWSHRDAKFYHLANHAKGTFLVGKVKPGILRYGSFD